MNKGIVAARVRAGLPRRAGVAVLLALCCAAISTAAILALSSDSAPAGKTLKLAHSSARPEPGTAKASATAAPKLTVPLTTTQARTLVTRAATVAVIWLGPERHGQLRLNTGTSSEVELDYLQGAAVTKYSAAKPTFTYLVDSQRGTAATIAQLQAHAGKTAGRVRLAGGLTAILPPASQPQQVFFVISPARKLLARVLLSSPAKTPGALTAIARRVSLLRP